MKTFYYRLGFDVEPKITGIRDGSPALILSEKNKVNLELKRFFYHSPNQDRADLLTENLLNHSSEICFHLKKGAKLNDWLQMTPLFISFELFSIRMVEILRKYHLHPSSCFREVKILDYSKINGLSYFLFQIPILTEKEVDWEKSIFYNYIDRSFKKNEFCYKIYNVDKMISQSFLGFRAKELVSKVDYDIVSFKGQLYVSDKLAIEIENSNLNNLFVVSSDYIGCKELKTL